MSVVIDYEAIEKLVPSDLVKKIKEDVIEIKQDRYFTDIEKFDVQDSEYYTVLAFSTATLIVIYRYNKSLKTYDIKRLSISDYWFVKAMMEGENQ